MGKKRRPFDGVGNVLLSKADIAFWRELDAQSDRGFTIVACARLDETLIDLIRLFLVGAGRLNRDVEEKFFGGNSLITNFAAKTVFAFALGLISEKTYRDLQILREIRNEFAHFSESVSFDTPSVRDRCRELSWSSLIPSLRDKSGRTQYRVALKQISGEIVGKALELTPGVPAAGKALENLQRQRESRPER